MPPKANTPRNRRRPQDQFLDSIGKVGRQTGLTVDERERDEDGYEKTDGWFSSASKAPGTAHTSYSTRSRKSDSSRDSSRAMDVASSPGPDPQDALSARRLRHSGQTLPQRTSPKKTNIGATPRRPPSASASQPNDTPQSENRAPSTGPVSRLLDFSTGDTRSALRASRQSTGSSPRRSGGTLADITPRGVRSSVYSISPSPERGRDAAPVYDEGTGHGTELEQRQDASRELKDTVTGDQETEEPSFSVEGGMGDDDGVPQLDDDVLPDHADDEDGELPAVEDEPDTSLDVAPETDANIDPSLLEKTKRKRGRPRKAESATKGQGAKAAQADKKRPGRKPMAEKDKNKKVASSTFKKPYIPGVPKPLQRPREQTPFEEDDEITITRSGRHSFKPLAEWKNERAVFEFNTIGDKNGTYVPTTTNIIRMEDVTPVKRKYKSSQGQQGPAKRKKRAQTVFEDDDDPNDAEEAWEAEEGIIRGPVRIWDPETQEVLMDDAKEPNALVQEEEIAYASSKIEARDNGEGSFKFAKTLTKPYFGCGIVELPPGGFKRLKPSRRMQMMFFVHFGKVTVQVTGTRFTITKGGVWQVPRGNYYSIENETEWPAKIFFSQGCEVDLGSSS